MSENTGDLDAYIQEKLDSDADFQSSIAELPEEEQQQAIVDKKSDLARLAFKEKAEEAQKALDEANKAREIAKNQEIRAKKAEAEAKKPKETETHKKLSLEELEEATELLEIPKEDRQEVIEYAERKGISIAEAKKAPFIKTFLNTQKEERTSAQMANTKSSKRGSSTTDEQVLNDFRNGKYSEKDEDIEALVRAEMEEKRRMAKS